MLKDSDRVQDLIDYYREQGAPSDQQMLMALLREVQEMDGGVLKGGEICRISEAYGVKESMLRALIRRMPGIRLEDAPHRLEICGTCRESRRLAEEIQREYQVTAGMCSEKGRFVFRVTGCMKNCRQGPSIKWDGGLYAKADMELIRRLIQKSGNDR